MKVAVVGAGLGGLAVAHALRINGFQNVRLFDRFSDPLRHGSFAGLGLSLQPNGLAVLRKIGMWESVKPHLYPLRDWVNGDSSGNPFGAPGDIRILRRDYGDYMYGVARSALITTLRDALPSEILNFGYDITGIRMKMSRWTKYSSRAPSVLKGKR